MNVLTQIGRYRVESELGRGAMGVVFKAFDPVVERVVAIKTIPLSVEDPEVLVHRLQREAKAVGQLEHPNIVTLYDAGEASGAFYIAMQFIQGETLQERMSRQRWFLLKEIQVFFRQICAALDYAHRLGVVHRDIKPSNIMITPEGLVKLTDFGIAKLAGAGTTSPGMIMGTPSYMSPEQALGKTLDGRSDIFSLGSILYELITGEQAFPGLNATTVMYRIVHEPPSPMTSLQPGLDPAVEAIVLKALTKQPGQRYQTCAELAAAVDCYVPRGVAEILDGAGPGESRRSERGRGCSPIGLEFTGCAPTRSGRGGEPACHRDALAAAIETSLAGRRHARDAALLGGSLGNHATPPSKLRQPSITRKPAEFLGEASDRYRSGAIHHTNAGSAIEKRAVRVPLRSLGCDAARSSLTFTLAETNCQYPYFRDWHATCLARREGYSSATRSRKDLGRSLPSTGGAPDRTNSAGNCSRLHA